MSADVAGRLRDERARIAATLHDDTLQRVLSLAQDVEDLTPVLGHATSWRLRTALEQLGESLRVTTASLAEEDLDRVSLHEALARIARAAELRGRLAVQVEVGPGADGIHDAAVREWVRELLANVLAHARATRCDVRVRADRTVVEVTVRDNGIGASEAEVERAIGAGHLGLARLRRTADALGGSFTICSRYRGTLATMTVVRAELAAQARVELLLGEERRDAGMVLAAIRDGVAIVRDGVVVHVNDELCALLDVAREAVLGQDASVLWPAPARGAAERALALAADGGTTTFGVRVHTGDEAWTAHVRLQPVELGPAAVLAVVRDLR